MRGADRLLHGLEAAAVADLLAQGPLTVMRHLMAEERWQTVGMIGGVTVFVAHTWPEPDSSGEDVGRIISARKATAHERRTYEEGRF